MCTDRLYNVTCMLSICVGFILRDIERGGGLKQYADFLGGKTLLTTLTGVEQIISKMQKMGILFC